MRHYRFIHQSVPRLFVAALVLLPWPGFAAEPDTPSNEMIERLQEGEQDRLQRRLDDVWLPGEKKKAEPETPAEREDGTCFHVERIEIRTLPEAQSPLSGLLRGPLDAAKGRCLSLADIKALQRSLGNLLLERGFITSRVLMPEQSLADGTLELVLVTGRLEAIEADGVDPGLVAFAMPDSKEQALRLQSMEQAVENLNRLPALDVSLDVKPGTETGRSILVAEGRRNAPLAASVMLDEKVYGSIDHGRVNASIETGVPLNWPDRLIVSVNADIDQEKSDTAWGTSLDYDVGLGYWLLGAGYSRQAYENEVDGVFQDFQADGYTDVARLESSRVLFRSGLTRLTAGVLGRYTEVQNRLENETIRVSSYRLGSAGMRLDFTQRWGRWEWGSVLTWESGDADGPATDLPGDTEVADHSWEKSSLYASLLRPFKWHNASLQWRVNHQYSADELFPVERLSLTARVKGYEQLAQSGNTGTTSTLEAALVEPAGRGSWRPYLQYQYGAIHGHRTEHHYFRLASATAGVVIGYPRLSLTLENTWPMEPFSTEESRNEYVAHAAIQYSW